MSIARKSLVFVVFSSAIQCCTQTAWAAPSKSVPFQISANWQTDHQPRNEARRRSGDDRDRINEHDVGVNSSDRQFDRDTRTILHQIRSAARSIEAALNGDAAVSVNSLHEELTALSNSVSDYLDKHGSRLPVKARAKAQQSLAELNTSIEGNWSGIQIAVIWIVQNSVGALDAIIQEFRANHGQ